MCKDRQYKVVHRDGTTRRTGTWDECSIYLKGYCRAIEEHGEITVDYNKHDGIVFEKTAHAQWRQLMRIKPCEPDEYGRGKLVIDIHSGKLNVCVGQESESLPLQDVRELQDALKDFIEHMESQEK